MPDDLDRLLTRYFQPGPAKADIPQRVLEILRRRRGPERFNKTISVEASERGVRRIDSSEAPRRARSAERGRAGGRVCATGGAPARRLAERAKRELSEYLEGRRSFFTVRVDFSSLPAFQRRVLEAACRIPFGETRTYAWIARRIGHPRAARAVGTALARNPVPLIVPCHRVLRSDGALGGYALGLDMKKRLLTLERTTPVLEGCSTTRVVCRVGCDPAGGMRPDRRVIFASVSDARSVGYRPCKVCRPAVARNEPA
jgi:methylated-DNA-[protein]-cysteine S-methyltransferase